MASKKLDTRTKTSKLRRTRRARRPKTLKLFEKDIDNRTLKQLEKQKLLSIDTETGGLDPRVHSLLLVQICTEDGRVVFIRRPDHNSTRLIELFKKKYITWIFHHAMFDLQFLSAGTSRVPEGNIECTKTLMKVAYPKLRSGLGAALREILDIHIDKDIAHEWDKKKLTKRQLEYASNDVLELHNLYRALINEINFFDYEVYCDAMKTIKLMADLQIKGYGDLLRYEQKDPELVARERSWWITKPMAF